MTPTRSEKKNTAPFKSQAKFTFTAHATELLIEESYNSHCFVVIRIQNHEFQTAVYSSLALFEIYKLHIVSVSEK